MKNLKNILVVGGAGYIGSHTVLALKDAGFRVVVFDNFSTGHRDACFGDLTIEGDLSDAPLLAKVLKEHEIACVVHFAALIEAGISVTDPLPFFRTNVASTISLLEAMGEAGVSRLVFSSTAAVYGDQESRGLLTETLPVQPTNPYGKSKAMVEGILQTMADAYGMNVLALRYFNAAGADPECRTGERHDPETHLIPLTIDAARNLRPSIKKFGTDYPTKDGTCVRDYIHVVDLASGHLAAVSKLINNEITGFSPINLGTGEGKSVSEVIEMVKTVSVTDFTIIEEPRREGDPAYLVAAASKAEEVLQWRPKHSDLKTIVEDAWRFAVSQRKEL